ncbi:hypothetical protein HPP92_013636 [Vanilla planifolia]|uniref:Uncharacterized protein n=1 Tax=Vanilla planifolia TaxID=51239 RepID=A0A835R3X0_VANPL|nr:hypothetical protein HPP92_014073 [Vanilla planifolia]KAG0478917.1 hypothetical protein HPP92_013636 [Vanilla planifolia]
MKIRACVRRILREGELRSKLEPAAACGAESEIRSCPSEGTTLIDSAREPSPRPKWLRKRRLVLNLHRSPAAYRSDANRPQDCHRFASIRLNQGHDRLTHDSPRNKRTVRFCVMNGNGLADDRYRLAQKGVIRRQSEETRSTWTSPGLSAANKLASSTIELICISR